MNVWVWGDLAKLLSKIDINDTIDEFNNFTKEYYPEDADGFFIPKDKRLNFDVWFNKESALILKVTYSRMGNWEYRVKNFE